MDPADPIETIRFLRNYVLHLKQKAEAKLPASMSHRLLCDDLSYQCQICQIFKATMDNAKDAPDEDLLTCPFCLVSFPSAEEFELHLSRYTSLYRSHLVRFVNRPLNLLTTIVLRPKDIRLIRLIDCLRSGAAAAYKDDLNSISRCPLCLADAEGDLLTHLSAHSGVARDVDRNELLLEVEMFRKHCLFSHYELMYDGVNAYMEQIKQQAMAEGQEPVLMDVKDVVLDLEVLQTHCKDAPEWCSYCVAFRAVLLHKLYAGSYLDDDGKVEFRCFLSDWCQCSFPSLDLLIRHLLYAYSSAKKSKKMTTKRSDPLHMIVFFLKHWQRCTSERSNCVVCFRSRREIVNLRLTKCPFCLEAVEEESLIDHVLRRHNFVDKSLVYQDDELYLNKLFSDQNERDDIPEVVVIDSDDEMEQGKAKKKKWKKPAKKELSVTRIAPRFNNAHCATKGDLSPKLAMDYIQHMLTVHTFSVNIPGSIAFNVDCATCNQFSQKFATEFDAISGRKRCVACSTIVSNPFCYGHHLLTEHMHAIKPQKSLQEAPIQEAPQENSVEEIPEEVLTDFVDWNSPELCHVAILALIQHSSAEQCKLDDNCFTCYRFRAIIDFQDPPKCIRCGVPWTDATNRFNHLYYHRYDRPKLDLNDGIKNAMSHFYRHCKISHLEDYFDPGSEYFVRNQHSEDAPDTFPLEPPWTTCLYCAAFRSSRLQKLLTLLLVLKPDNQPTFQCLFSHFCKRIFISPRQLLNHLLFQHALSSRRKSAKDDLALASLYLKHMATHPRRSSTVTIETGCISCWKTWMPFGRTQYNQECVFCLARVKDSLLKHFLAEHANLTAEQTQETVEEVILRNDLEEKERGGKSTLMPALINWTNLEALEVPPTPIRDIPLPEAVKDFVPMELDELMWFLESFGTHTVDQITFCT